MNKTLKYIIGAALTISLGLNLISVILLSNYSIKFNDIENRLAMLPNSIALKNNKISATTQPAKEENQNDIMTPNELSKYLKIDIQKIYSLIIENPKSEFPCLKINGEVRFSKNAIDEYMLKGNNLLE